MIFGSFRDIQLPDIMALVGRRNGRLVIRNHPAAGQAEMFFRDGCLVAFSVSQQPVAEVVRVRDWLVAMMRSQEGEFQFEGGVAPSWGIFYALQVDHLLLASMTALDEINAFEAELPHEQTYFRVIQENDGWLDPDLSAFWEAAAGMLQRGTNGAHLAATVGISVERVRLYLYKLRAAGWIVPYRPGTRILAFAEPPRQVAAAAPAQNHGCDGAGRLRHARIIRPEGGVVRGLIERLAGVLRGGRA